MLGLANRITHNNARSGQAMVEYVVVAGMLVLFCTIMAVILFVFREHSNRILDLLSSDYP